jgi:hypothetical protein
MATCDKCHAKGLIAAVLGDQTTVLLDAHARCYVAVDEHMDLPTDGARVFLTHALVEHAALCTAAKRQQAEDRAAGKTQYDRQKAAKGGRV